MTSVRYIIITPARNEEEFIGVTIDSVAAQTVLPTRWIIVNDGSCDQTGAIIDQAAKRYAWIQAVQLADRGFRQAGGGVMEAFYAGLMLLADEEWDFLVKLDGDVSFEPSYFEDCFVRFSAEHRLGIGGGLVCRRVSGALRPESEADPSFHVRGATKIYKYDCWQAIGGLVKGTGWDTVDELKANMLGWQTSTFNDIEIVHHRRTGDAYGMWPNWVKNGYANYATGYHPLFMLLKCLRRLFDKPYGIAGLALCVGFFGGYFRRAWRVEDPDLIRFLRRQQMQRLLGRPSLWG